MTYRSLARTYLEREKWDGAASLYQRAVSTYKRCGKQSDAAISLGELGVTKEMGDDSASAKKLYNEAIETLGVYALVEERAILLERRGDLQLRSGELSDAMEDLKEALSVQKRVGNKYAVATDYATLSIVYDELKLVDKAEECFILSVAAGREVGWLASLGEFYQAKAELAQALGNARAADRNYQRTRRISTILDANG